MFSALLGWLCYRRYKKENNKKKKKKKKKERGREKEAKRKVYQKWQSRAPQRGATKAAVGNENGVRVLGHQARKQVAANRS